MVDVNWSQVLFNSCITGSLYLIAAVGLTLTYGLSKFPNFAHAEFMTLGGYVGFFVAKQLEEARLLKGIDYYSKEKVRYRQKNLANYATQPRTS